MTMTPHDDTPPMAFGLSVLDENTFVASMLSDLKTRQEKRARRERTWNACWKAYKAEGDTLNMKGTPLSEDNSAVARPIVFQAIENLHATIMSQLFPKSGRFFHVFGQHEQDHVDAPMIEKMLHCKLSTQGFQSAYSLFLKQLLITGNSVMMMPWVVDHATVTRQMPVVKMGITLGMTAQTDDVIKEQGPRFEVLNIMDVYIDEGLKDWRQGTLMRRVHKKLAQLGNEARYKNKEQVLLTLQTQANESKSRKTGPISLQEETVTLLEVWGDLWVNGMCHKQYVAVMVEETGTLLRFEPHQLEIGQPPFVVSSLIPMPHEGYGIGAVEKSLGLQHAVNTLTNQKLDILNLCINTPFTYLLNDDVFDPTALNYRPGALIPVKNHDTLRPLPMVAQNINLAFQEIADLKIEIMETTGSLRLMSGALEGTTHAPRTATEVNTLMANANRKYDGTLMHLEQSCLEPMLQLVYALCRQFWVYPEQMRHISDEGVASYEQMSPDVFQRSMCEVKVIGSRGQLKQEQELEGLVFFTKMLQALPDAMSRLNMDGLLKRIVRHLGFNEDELLKSEKL